VNTAQRVGLFIALVVCCVTPAYANNPPQPDGLFSVLLIFPAVIVGRRLAGVSPVSESLAKRIATAFILLVCVILCLGGTGLALVPLIIIAGYGIVRATQILRKGQGRKRIVIATALIGLVLFAVTDYFASLLSYDPAAVMESIAMSRLRSLATAEQQFKTPVFAKGASSPTYATMAELEDAQLLAWNLAPSTVRSGYIYGEVIDKPHDQFFFYAVPAFPRKHESRWYHLIPGGSLLEALLGKQRGAETGYRSFAVDETGVIRFATQRNLGAPVTREEVATWKTFP
jgi:hypothetical protein